MTAPDPQLRILAPRSTANRLSRRGFLGGLGALAAGGALSACGGSSSPSTPSATSGTTAGASPSAAATTASGPKPAEGQLNFYNWADYDDPTLVKAFASQNKLTTRLDVYDANAEAVAKLNATKGTSGYDIFVPTGGYIAESIKNGLLLQLDHSQIPNLANLSPQVLKQPWDPTNAYSVCKDWGSTGFMYDKTVIKRDLKTWADFIDAMNNEASGKTSVLEEPEEVVALYFWSKSPAGDWTSSDPAELDAAEAFVLDKVAPHVKAYDSYPGTTFSQGKYALSMVWNGDARQGLIAAKHPERYQWVLGAPLTELWMDNWTIVAGAPHPNAAHAWINYILDPVNAYKDMAFHGYDCGISAVHDKALADKLPYTALIFYSDAQVKNMSTYMIGPTLQRRISIYQKAKAKSAG